MKQALKNLYHKQMFNPGLLGIFINPFYFSRKYLYQAVRSNASFLSGQLLDLGCGSKPYKYLFNVDEYIGIEIGDEREHNGKDIDKFYDGKTLPFDNNTFDAVFSSQVFEHIFNLDDILKELNRVLKPGGTILVTLPFAWPEHEQPWDFARYTSFGIKSLFERNGFEVVKMEKTGNYPTTLCQLWAAFISQFILQKPTLLKLALTAILIGPINLIGIICSTKKKTNDSYYLDNVIVVKKLQEFTNYRRN